MTSTNVVHDNSHTAQSFVTVAELDAISRLPRDPGGPARLRVAEIAIDLLDGSLGEQERLLINDVLQRLAAKAPEEVRVVMARRLASNPNAPHELIVLLANDNIVIARPVLLWSNVLSDDDLVHIVRNRSAFHSRSIAMRRTLAEAVTDALVETADEQSISFVVQNAGARISAVALMSIALLARNLDRLQAHVLRRPEISSEIADALYWHVSAELREHLVARFKLNHPIQEARQPASSHSHGSLAYVGGRWAVQ